MKRRRVTYADIAAGAGVSRATVSLVIQGSSLIAPSTRSRVESEIARQGYVYNRAAANLRRRRSSSVAMVINDLSNPFFAEFAAGVDEALAAAGYVTLLGSTGESVERQQKVLATLMEHDPAGIILSPAENSDGRRLLETIGAHTPTLVFNRDLPDSQKTVPAWDFLALDNRHGARLVTAHLLALGHRRIAFFGGHAASSSCRERRKGYIEAMAAAGAAADDGRDRPALVRAPRRRMRARAHQRCGHRGHAHDHPGRTRRPRQHLSSARAPRPRSPQGTVRMKTTSERTALSVVTVIFFMWGFITVLNDVLIPHLKSVFTLNYAQVMLVQFTFFGAYFVMSLPSGKVVSHYGYRLSIIAGLAITGIGALLFLPAARLPSYPLFLGAFFVLASGITLLQVAANPYVSLLGPPQLASSRLNLAQALNSLGTTLAPKLGGLLILSTAVLGADELAKLPAARQLAYRMQQAQMVQLPYLCLAGVLFALAFVVWMFHLPPLSSAEADDPRHRFADALAHRRVWLGMLAIFLYVGAEVSIGSFMINYLSLPQIGHMSEAAAAGYVSLYWGGAMVGRFVGSALLTRMDPRRLLAIFATVAGLLVATTMLTHGDAALYSVVAIGLFNSIMFPNIFTLGIEKFGPLTGKVSSLLVMAIVGGAVVPLLQGALADRIGVQPAFALPLLCYAYIVYYGLRGSRAA